MPWRKLDPVWRECFELAWQAFSAGTIPVGAVVVDGSGAVVARGRNRIFDREAPRGQLAGSLLAHAELNALAGLEPVRQYGAHELYTTLEPCALCIGAALMTMIRSVRYASSDPYGGGAAFRIENPHTARQPLVVEGPLDGLVGDLGELLHVAHFLWRKPHSEVVAAHRDRSPHILRLAESIDLMAASQNGATLDDAVALVAGARS